MLKKIFIIFPLLFFSSLVFASDKSFVETQIRKLWGIYLERKAEDGKFEDLNGKSHKLSDFKGKVIFLNFWGIWCPACRRQLPSIQDLYKKYKDNKNFILIAVEIEGNSSILKAFKRKTNYDIPFFSDTRGMLSRKYKIMAIPTTFIIDKNFNIIAKFIGARNWTEESFYKLLDCLLK